MAKTWIWAPVVLGPLFDGDDASHHVQLNGPTTINPLTGMVDPPTTPVRFTSIIPEDRDSRSATYGQCCVSHAKVRIAVEDRPRCTNEVPESAVSIEDRLMVALMEAEGQPSEMQRILERAANVMTTADGRRMGARLLTQARYRKLPEAKADSLTRTLELDDALQANEIERACAELRIIPTDDELAGTYAWVRLAREADPRAYFDHHPKFTRWVADRATPGRYFALAARTTSIPPVVITR